MKKSEMKLCGELDFSVCLLTEFVSRATEFDEVLLRYVHKPWDKMEENENMEAAQPWLFPPLMGWKRQVICETLVDW